MQKPDVLSYTFKRAACDAVNLIDRFEIAIANLCEDDAAAVLMFIDRLSNARREINGGKPEPLATYKTITGGLRRANA